jgi:prolyl oligopeptidase
MFLTQHAWNLILAVMILILRLPVPVGLAFLLAGCTQMPTTLKYPGTATTKQVDVLHGVSVADPYRWLEDDHSPQTKEWVQAQNRLTFGWLDQIPERAALRARLTKLWDFERYGVPFKEGGRYFFSRNNGLQNQSVLYTLSALEAEPTMLLDPNLLSADGTVALAGYAVSRDGNLLAYGLSVAGSDWQEWRVRDVRTGQDRPDLLQWVKFSGAAWTRDGQGFFYSRYDTPTEESKLTKANYYHKLYYHRLGTLQAEDRLVYHRPDHKEWNFQGQVSDDGRYLVISSTEGTSPKRRIFYQELQPPNAPVVPLLTEFDAAYHFVDNSDTVFWFRTDLNAPRGRLVAINITQPARTNWTELIPQAGGTMVSVHALGNRFVVAYLRDAHSQVRVFSLEGRPEREIALPGLGTVGGFAGRRSDMETFFSFTSYTVPGAVYRHDMQAAASKVFRQPSVDFAPAAFETRQVFYRSKDGTRVPMFLTHRQGLALDGRNPTLLYGYGGFNIPLTPAFSVSIISWLEWGGVYAVANLRGGGEYGEEWHQAGTRLHKQNVFDDFIAAGEWLVANHYTAPSKLAISGGSNGGLLVGAVLNQRPDLFGAALPAVGVMDMLRFHKFTIGWAWASDYGSPDDPAEFQALRAYSPLHNIRPGRRYPAVLITTADHDDRVVPAHSFKYAATLQKAQAGPAPILIRIETKAGHGAGKPTGKLIEEATDRQAFLVRALGMTNPVARRGVSNP